jgi:hypothetical protein
METKKIIFYIILIAVILVAVFLSQQAYSKNIIKNFISYVSKYAVAALTGAPVQEPISSSEATRTTEAVNNLTTQVNGESYTATNPTTYETMDDKWTITNFPQKIVESVKSGGETAINSIENTTNKISENISTAKENITNYFSGISNAIQGKSNQPTETSNNCVCPKP